MIEGPSPHRALPAAASRPQHPYTPCSLSPSASPCLGMENCVLDNSACQIPDSKAHCDPPLAFEGDSTSSLRPDSTVSYFLLPPPPGVRPTQQEAERPSWSLICRLWLESESVSTNRGSDTNGDPLSSPS